MFFLLTFIICFVGLRGKVPNISLGGNSNIEYWIKEWNGGMGLIEKT